MVTIVHPKPTNLSHNKMSLLKSFIVMTLVLLATTSHAEQENSLTLNYGHSTSDYFGDDVSDLTSHSSSVIYSREISTSWRVSGSYYNSEAQDKWLTIERDNLNAFNRASVDSKGFGLSTSWDPSDYSFSVGYNQSNNNERSVTFLPRVLESLESRSQVINFSIDKTVSLGDDLSLNQWGFDWVLGLQQAKLEAEIKAVVGSDIPILVNSDIELKQLSSFIGLELSYWYQTEKFVLTPFLSLDWNFEINTSGQQTVLLLRGGDQRPVNLLDGRFSRDVNIPDSGQWEVGFGVLFDSGWSAELTYGQSLSTEYPIDSINFSISVFF